MLEQTKLFRGFLGERNGVHLLRDCLTLELFPRNGLLAGLPMHFESLFTEPGETPVLDLFEEPNTVFRNDIYRFSAALADSRPQRSVFGV